MPESDSFDRMIGALHGLPDVTATKPTTVRAIIPLIGAAQTFIVQTFRQRETDSEHAKSQDTIFVEAIGANGTVRLALPPKVADVIARQRDSLTDRVRSKSAQAVADERKRLGIKPAFLKGKK